MAHVSSAMESKQQEKVSAASTFVAQHFAPFVGLNVSLWAQARPLPQNQKQYLRLKCLVLGNSLQFLFAN